VNKKYLAKNEKLLCFIGPSGAGKSRVVNKLIDDNIIDLTPSWTTRPKRSHEASTKDHIFVSTEEFNFQKSEGIFLEVVKLFDMPYLYGLPKVAKNSSAVPTVMLRSMVIPLLSKYYIYPVIYHIESTRNLTLKRLNNRHKTEEEVNKRMAEYDQEVAIGRKIAQRIFINDDEFDKLYEQIKKSIRQDFYN